MEVDRPPTPFPPGGRSWDGLSIGRGIENDVLLAWWAGAEQTALVLGPPRSGKTSAIVIPSVIDGPGAVVSTSTKPDVLLATSNRRRFGTCYVFDPTSSIALPDGVQELRWSPLSGCDSFDASVSMAHALASAGRPGAGYSESSHWVERAEALLAPLFHAAAVSGKTMREVCGWVLGHDVREAEAILSVAGAQMAKVTLSSVWRTEERERSGIFSTAASLLWVYRSEAALSSACDPNFDPERFAASRDTVYVCAPAHAQDQLAPLVVALLEQIRAACYLRRRQHPDSVPVLFVLDEVANIAPLPSLPQLASEGVSQGVVTMVCLQDLSQARTRWGPAADGFFSLFGTKIIFPGIADHSTLELVSALLGDVEVPTQSVSVPDRPGMSIGQAIVKRALMGPSKHPVDRTPVVTTSTIFRRRMPVDEVYRGMPGHVLGLSSRLGTIYMPTMPWWDVAAHIDRQGAASTVELEATQRPEASPSPWHTLGPRVVARNGPGWKYEWIVVVPGEPLPPVQKKTQPPAALESADADGRSSRFAENPAARAVAAERRHRQGDEADGAVMVRVLGPVEVTGWIEEPTRRVVTEMACFLALHAHRNVTPEELRAALWAGDLGASEANAKSLRNAVSLLRKSLGPDVVPEAHKGSGYRLTSTVECDWAIFSEAAETADGPHEKEKLRHALSLVRGAPFEGVAAGTFTWAWTELFVSRMEIAIAAAAKRLGALALAENDVALSVWAVLQGLSASLYDRELWHAYLVASARSGREVLERAWKSASAVMGDDCGDLIQAVDTLRSEAGIDPVSTGQGNRT
jgi:DNA-binding SARP family transcriptional activator